MNVIGATEDNMTCDNETVLSLPLEEFELSVRTSNCMKSQNIITIGDLVNLSEADLLKFPNFGRKCLAELKVLLGGLGLGFVRDVDKQLFLLETEKPPYSELSESELVDKYREMGLFKKAGLLGLSVRSANCLGKLGVTYIGDLVIKRRNELLNTPNFGRKSLTEIENALINMGLRFDMTLRDWPPKNLRQIAEKTEQELAHNVSEPMIEAFNRTIENISDPRHVLIIESRFGINGEKRTLEDIAQELGITRERVRQIQKKTTQIILNNEFWDDILRIKLDSIMQSRITPLYLDELGVEDEWFAGFEENLPLLRNIIIAFGENEDLHFLEVNNRIVVARISPELWEEVKFDLLSILEHSLENAFTLDDVELFVEDKMIKTGAPELSSLMFEIVSGYLNFSFSNGEMTLVSVGNTLASYLRAILEDEETPVHYERVAELYEERFGISISTRYVHACLGYNDFILFDSGTYGLPKHLDISCEDQAIIIAKVEECIESGPLGRQWHSRNLPRLFEGYDFFQNLDKYKITAILKKSDKLRYLGKFLWKINTDSDDTSERLHIKKAAYDILKEAGKPLHTDELISEITKLRGVGEHLQLHPNEVFSRIDPSTWGLLERDFMISLQEQQAFRDHMYDVFSGLDKALHKTELLNAIGEYAVPEGVSDGHIVGILVIDDRFKSWHGGYIGLSSWQSSGRKTFTQVMKEIAEEAFDTITTDEIVNRARNKLGYDFQRNSISAYLNKYGLSYDRERGIWHK